jgi:hypothetical protein
MGNFFENIIPSWMGKDHWGDDDQDSPKKTSLHIPDHQLLKNSLKPWNEKITLGNWYSDEIAKKAKTSRDISCSSISEVAVLWTVVWLVVKGKEDTIWFDFLLEVIEWLSELSP